MDSDDWFEDDAVAILLEANMQNPSLMTSARLYDVRFDQRRNVFQRAKTKEGTHSGTFSIEYVLGHIYDFQFYFLHAKLFRSDIIRRHKLIFRENIYYGEDLVFTFEYLIKTDGMSYIDDYILNLFYRPDSAMHVPYKERRTFVNGTLNDFTQLIIDIADTPERKRLLRIHHTKNNMSELMSAVLGYAGKDRLRQIREKVKLYLNECISSGDLKLNLSKRLFVWLRLYLPVPLIYIFAALDNAWQNIKTFCRDMLPRDREDIPYW